MKKIIFAVKLFFIFSQLIFADMEKHIDYIKEINPKLNQVEAEKLYNIFQKHSERYDIDIEVALAVASVESQFRETALSQKGAYGIMQIMPRTAEYYGKNEKILDENIEMGLKHLRDGMKRFGTNTDISIASYNIGFLGVQNKNYNKIPETKYFVSKVSRELSKLGKKLKYDKEYLKNLNFSNEKNIFQESVDGEHLEENIQPIQKKAGISFNFGGIGFNKE